MRAASCNHTLAVTLQCPIRSVDAAGSGDRVAPAGYFVLPYHHGRPRDVAFAHQEARLDCQATATQAILRRDCDLETRANVTGSHMCMVRCNVCRHLSLPVHLLGGRGWKSGERPGVRLSLGERCTPNQQPLLKRWRARALGCRVCVPHLVLGPAWRRCRSRVVVAVDVPLPSSWLMNWTLDEILQAHVSVCRTALYHTVPRSSRGGAS